MLPFHPYADLFPLIEGEDFAQLVADVKANDLRERIVVWDGAILDGRNRYRACLAAGLIENDDGPDRAKYFVRFVPGVDGDALAFVISKNLARRHLNESQRSYIAAKLANLQHGGDRKSDGDQAANLPLENEPPPTPPPAVTQAKAAALLNVSQRSVRAAKAVQDKGTPELQRAVEQGTVAVSAAEKLAALPAEDQIKVVAAPEPAKAARAEISRHNRDERLDEITRGANGASPALDTSRQFSIIYADPPWQFDVWSRETGLEKCPDRHYPTMTVEEICALPIGEIVAPNALLFLWITVPKLNRMYEIFSAWGRVLCDDQEYGVIRQPWTYVSNYNWDKVNIGPGRWNRNQHEHLLIAKIGSVPAPLPSQRVRSNYTEAREEHSAKPDHFAKLIETQFPQLAKIELFRRGPARPGWSVWGNQAEPNSEMSSHLDAEPAVMVSPPAAGSTNPDDPLLDIPPFLRRKQTDVSVTDERLPERAPSPESVVP